MTKKIMERTERKIAKIDNMYSPKIFRLEEEKKQLDIWLREKPKAIKITKKVINDGKQRVVLLTKEIAELKKEKKEQFLKLFQEKKMIAPSLKELNRLRGGNFKESPCNTGITITTVKDAYSKMTEEGAYYCGHCNLWIVGLPKTGPAPGNFFGRHDYYFCGICGSTVGMFTPETQRFIDRAYRP